MKYIYSVKDFCMLKNTKHKEQGDLVLLEESYCFDDNKNKKKDGVISSNSISKEKMTKLNLQKK